MADETVENVFFNSQDPEARGLMRLIVSLGEFVFTEDIGMPRLDFLRKVASRILDVTNP